MQSSLLNRMARFTMATFNKPTILQNLRTYKNSPAQAHLHDYVRDQAQLEKTKKQKVDSEFITKQSNGVLMFRQFSFQQKTEQTLVPHLNCYLPPTGSWTYEQIRKELGQFSSLSKTQEVNVQIMEECQTDIEKAIKQYYTNIGKKNYQFNLQQQINKINQMTDEQFRHFARVLNNQPALQQSPVQPERTFKRQRRMK